MQEPGQSETEVPPPIPKFNKPLPYIGPRNARETAVLICALGILLCFFAPWRITPFGHTVFRGSTLFKVDESAAILWTIPILALAVVAVYRHKKLSRQVGTIASIVTIIYLSYFLGVSHVVGLIRPAWGASLTIWFSLGLFAFCSERRIATPADFVARKLRSRKAEVFSHWGTLTPGCHFSTQQFYSEIEQAIRAKQWPGVEMMRLDYREAGFLSHKREYLRIIRQRQLFDICAAVFGKDYFFSIREAQIPVVIDIRSVLSLLIGLFLTFMLSVNLLGLVFGAIAWLFLLSFGAWFLFNVLKLGLTKADTMLLQMPVLGAFYEAWFRRDTYFQQDSRLVFLQCVNELVKEHVEETTSAKGLKFLNCFENQPLLDGLYKRSRIQLSQTDAATFAA
ncbi:MAG TPA: hypothetical protein VFW05_12275 [Verrucomicrobiae bacterium]|nr:hypothetical protein [Verrucomicrobiae bacterium]